MSKLVNEASIPALLEEMSVKEKVDLLVGKSFFSTQEMPKYGIPSIRYLDGATGVNLMQYMGELVGLKMAVESEETPEEAPAEEKQPSGQETKDDVSNNESGAAFMGLVGYATNHKPLPEDMTAEQREMIEGLRALVDSVRPEGRSRDVSRRVCFWELPGSRRLFTRWARQWQGRPSPTASMCCSVRRTPIFTETREMAASSSPFPRIPV